MFLALGNTKAFTHAFFIGALYYPPIRRQAEFGFLQIANSKATREALRHDLREHRSVAARRVRFET